MTTGDATGLFGHFARGATLGNDWLTVGSLLSGEDMDSQSLGALELELRLLPGVVGVGLDERQEELTVRLFVSPEEGVADLRRRASEVGKSHSDRPIFIEIEGASAAAEDRHEEHPRTGRVALLAVRSHEAANEVEVHLSFHEARTVGRGSAGHGRGAAMATLEALEGLGARLRFRVEAVASVSLDFSQTTVVVLRPLSGEGDRMGVAMGSTLDESASRATLNALNRYLETEGYLGRHALARDEDVLAGPLGT